jgi:hypothetical protein
MDQKAYYSDLANKKLEKTVQDDEHKRRLKELQEYRGEK